MGRKKKRKKSATAISPLPYAKKTAAEKPHRNSLPIWLAPASAIVLLLISGVIFGIQTNRWAVSADVEEAAARINDIPATIGDWKGEDNPIPQRVLKQAGAVGHLNRYYRNEIDGRRMHVMILCGSHGPISLHPPTVCFTSAGWRLRRLKKTVVKSDQGESLGEFQHGTFFKRDATSARKMTTFWSWNSSGDWLTPKRPRFAFAGSPHLYKIYVSEVVPVLSSDDEKDETSNKNCEEFMRLLLPALKKVGI